jgi:DNA-binding LacI/PurR family transcriptional regulator
MKPMKYADCANVIQSRVRRGDYAVRDMPTELELAEEIGVSRKTARRALMMLVEEGLLSRKPHGRLKVNRHHEQLAGRAQLAFLAPAFASPMFDRYRFAVESGAANFDADVRAVDYVHWDDAVISKTLSSFDGVFLMLSSETSPPAVLERLGQSGNVIVLDGDLSREGIPSIQLTPPAFLNHLAEHLYDLGHRHIACFNTQPNDEVINKLINQWNLWQKLRKVEGHLINCPVKPYQDALPAGYHAINKLLKAGKWDATAMLCITVDAAIGASRAFIEHGYQVGKDVSIGCFDGSCRSRYQNPSITSIEAPDPTPYLEICFEWFSQRAPKPWNGTLLVHPTRVPLFVGESTGPAPARPANATAR